MTVSAIAHHREAMSGLNQRKQLVVIGAVALLVRAICFTVSMQHPAARQLQADSHDYLDLAANLTAGHGLGRALGQHDATWVPELARTPGYPMIIAAFDWLGWSGQTAAIILQNLAYVGLAMIAAAIAGTWFGPVAGWFAGLWIALDTQAVALSNMIWTEPLYGVLLFAAAMATARVIARPRWQAAVVSGVLIAAGAYIRPTSLFLPTVCAVGLLAFALLRRNRALVVSALLVGVVGNALIGAWVVRNGRVCGEYTFTSISRALLLAYHGGATLSRAEGIPFRDARDRLHADLGISRNALRRLPLSAAENARVKSLAFKTIREHPKAFVAEYGLRSANIYCGPDKHILLASGLPLVDFGILPSDEDAMAGEGVALTSWTLLAVNLVFLGSVYVLLIRQLCLVYRKRWPPVFVWVCLAFSVYVLALSSGAPGDPRMRAPVMPMLVMVAAASLAPARSERRTQ